MPLIDAWKRVAYDTTGQPVTRVWDELHAKEKNIYISILRDKQTKVKGTVLELSEKYKMTPIQVYGFLDGIHEAIDTLPSLETIVEETEIAFNIDFERLYKQMVEYRAETLYLLLEWDEIFTKEEQKQFYTEQKKSHTIVRNEEKKGRNNPCPCGSGKKYKKCCGLE